jgi:RNA polymerase sigma-70 factor (ECF subfamily)
MSSADTSPTVSIDTLYGEHHSWLKSWLRARLGCPEQAADLAHDTFLRILSRSAAIREPRAFLRTVAHGLMVNAMRRRDLERAYLEALAEQVEPETPDPAELAAVIEILSQIETALAGLPLRVRHAFLLSQIDGLKYADIAARLSVSVSMVKKYMLRAITQCVRAQLS